MKCERDFIIGDVHGCLGMLKRLMDKIDWRPDKDRLIFLGDFIDRGKDSKGVVDFILELTRMSPHVCCLMGNHEKLFLDFLNGLETNLFLMNGGISTLESYHIKKRSNRNAPLIPPEHIQFLEDLKSWIELDDFYVVHAGLKPGVEIKEQSLEDLIWIRDRFIYSDFDFGKKIIFGHTPFRDPLVMNNKIGLDTGAVYGNRLTCLEIPGMKFHSVEAYILE